MTGSRIAACTVVAGVILSMGTGCPKRRESIVVMPTGHVTMNVEYEATGDGLDRGDAMPSTEGGWAVTRTVREDDGEEKHTLLAGRRFEPGEELPHSFAVEGDPDADLYLSFPTTLRIEERDEGTYYYFRRIYTPRPWAYVHLYEELFVKDHHRELANKPVEEMTPGERRTIIEAFAAAESYKQLEFAQAALAECDPQLAPEYPLLARSALLDAYMEVDWGEFADRCASYTDDDRRNACYEAQSQRILDTALDAFRQSLIDHAGYRLPQLTAFGRAYERARLRYEITNDLGVHQFEIEVEMPGRIVAHNADDVDEDDESATSSGTWWFDGRAFRDRSYELIMITCLSAEPGVEPRSPLDELDR